MKKVLFTLVDLNVGGVQKTLVSILNNLDYQKYQVDVMVLKKGNNQLMKLLPSKVKILYLEDYVSLPLKNNLYYRIKKNILLKSILKRYKNKFSLSYDVAIAFNGFNNYADLIVPMIEAKKRIIWVHNDFYNVIKYAKVPFVYKTMYRMMGKKFAYYDQIAIVANEVAETFNLLYRNKYHKKIKIINNYLDQEEIINKSNETCNYQFKNGFNIVAVGRLCKAKNFQMLIKLQKRLYDANYQVNIYLVGDGEKRLELEQAVLKNNLGDSFFFLGNQLNPYPFIKKADLFLSTSLYESFANTVIESLILGVPVVATNTAGARNIQKNIAYKNTCLIGNNEDEMYELIIKEMAKKNTVRLDYSKHNKKVMDEIYDLLT